ncbi:MAG: DUF1679 domain-containing protein [Gammaproteobacteria bacterium]|nr:DUF1679 domain-containing protein [Gammaproteobacteria bacterium]MYD79061.1 DUF1679 domain-containing protein [Gammaproteobacteria bacterium]
MASIDIPSSKVHISTEWLGQALGESFPGIGSAIKGIDISEIGVGFGLMAVLCRVKIEYTEMTQQYPNSVVVKMSSSDPASLGLAKSLDLYRREYVFYSEIQKVAKIRTPKLYCGAHDKKENRFFLVLEDLQSMKAVNQLDGASSEQAIVAVRAIARLHGQFWNRTDASELKNVYRMTPINAAAIHFVYLSNVEGSIEKFGRYYTPESEQIVRTIGRRATEFLIGSGGADETYTHGDYRLDNLFFDDNGECAAVDWQVSGTSNGFFDLAYFLTGSLAPATRRDVEREAVRNYCEVLGDALPTPITFEEGWELYRQAVLACLFTSVIVTGGLDLSVDRSNELVVEGFKRTLTAIEELNSGEFLNDSIKESVLGKLANFPANFAYSLYRMFRRNS